MKPESLPCKLILLIAITLATSCVSKQDVLLLQDKTDDGTTKFINPKQTAYRVQPGDNLYIKVYSVDPKTNKFFQSDLPTLMNPTYLYLNSYTVNEEGYINFSFIDKMFVKNLTIEEIRMLLQKTLNDYFKDATVSVKLVNFRITVLGEVNTPGEFTIDKDQINIFQAIGLARGIKDFGNPKTVMLVRQTTDGSEIYEVDLTDKKILESDLYFLMPNDLLYVKPLKAKSYIYGSNTKDLIFSSISLLILIATFYLNATK